MPSWVSNGTVGVGSTSATPGLPASLATGDGCLIMVVTKPDTAVINTPANWTLVLDVAGGGGTTGNQVGPTRQAWFFREKDAGWSTMPAVSVTSGNSTATIASRYTKTSGNVWNVVASTATFGDAGTTTTGGVTLGSNPGIRSGDLCVVGYSNMNDGITWSSASITATGLTMGASSIRSSVVETTTGSDIGGMFFTQPVTAGTASAAPVTTVSLGTAGRGTVGLVVLNESLPAVTITRSTTWNIAEPPPVSVAITRSTTWDTLTAVGYQPAVSANLITGTDATFESGIGSWSDSAGGVTATISTVRAHSGAQSKLLTWAGTGGNPRSALNVDSVVTPGALYRFGAWVYVPTGSPDVRLTANDWGPSNTINDAWQYLEMTFTARSSGNQVWIWGANNSVAGAQTWVDDVSLVRLSGSIAADDFTGTDSATGVWNGSSSTRSTLHGSLSWGNDNSNTWGISSNQLLTNGGGYLTVNTPVPDGVVEVDVSIGASHGSTGIAFRVSNANDNMRFVVTSSGFDLYKTVGGSNTLLSRTGTPSTNTTYRLRAEFTGNTVAVFVDDVQRGQATVNDSSIINNTKHGLYAQDGTTLPRWDNFSIRTPARVQVWDDFTAADSATGAFAHSGGVGRVAPTGQTWQGTYGGAANDSWGISGNKVYKVQDGSFGHLIVETYQANGIVEADITTGATVSGNSGLSVRFVDTNNFLRVFAGSNGNFYLQKAKGGGVENLDSIPGAVVGTTYHFRAHLDGNSVRVVVEGVGTLSGTLTDPIHLVGTKHGLYSEGPNDARFDNFKFTALPDIPREAEWRTLAVVGNSGIITDNFERVVGSGFGTSSSGHTWTLPWGGGQVNGSWGRLGHAGQVGFPDGAVAVIDSYATDATISVTKTAGAKEGWIVARFIDQNNFLRFNNSIATSRVGGVDTLIGGSNYEAAGFATGDTMTVELSGASVVMKKNGVTVHSGTVTLLTGTKHGIGIWETGGDNYYDNFSVVPVPLEFTRSTTWNVAEPPKVPITITRSTTWNVLPGIATSSGFLTLSGTATMRAAAPASTASLTITGAGTPQARAAATASMTLSGTGAARAPVASSTASMSLSATAAATASPTSTASLSLSATSTARAATAATAALDITGSATPQARAIGTAALTLSATGNATNQIAATGTASMTLSASGGVTVPAAGTGSLTLTGASTARAVTTSTASLTITGTGNAGVGRTATASLTITGAATAQVRATSSGSLTLAGSGAARAAVTGSAAMTLVATGTAVGRSTSFAALSITATGTALSQAAITATASLTLNGSAGVSGRATGAGSLSLLGVGGARGRTAGTASISFTGFAKIVRLDVTVFVGSTVNRSSVVIGPTSPQDFIVIGSNKNGTVTVGASTVFPRVTVGASQLRTFVIVNASRSGSVVVGENHHANAIVVDNGSATVVIGPSIHERVR